MKKFARLVWLSLLVACLAGSAPDAEREPSGLWPCGSMKAVRQVASVLEGYHYSHGHLPYHPDGPHAALWALEEEGHWPKQLPKPGSEAFKQLEFERSMLDHAEYLNPAPGQYMGGPEIVIVCIWNRPGSKDDDRAWIISSVNALYEVRFPKPLPSKTVLVGRTVKSCLQSASVEVCTAIDRTDFLGVSGGEAWQDYVELSIRVHDGGETRDEKPKSEEPLKLPEELCPGTRDYVEFR